MGLGAGLGDVDVVDVVDVAHGYLQKVDIALHPFAPKFCPFATPTSLHYVRFSISQQNRVLVSRPAPYQPFSCLERYSPEKQSPTGNWHLAAHHTAR